MTPETIRLVQESFRSLLPHADELTEAFFLRLIRTDPKLARLLGAGCSARRRMFLAGLAFAIETFDDFGNMEHGLRALGSACRHFGLGATELGTIRAVLLATIAQALGGHTRRSGWTPQVSAAWSEASAAVAAAVQEGCATVSKAA